MYTFISSGENELRKDGYFDNNLENVGFFGEGDERLTQPKHSGIITEWVDYSLEEYLDGKAKQLIYRYDEITGEREMLFTAWENHGQLSVTDLGNGSFFVSETLKGGENTQYLTDKDGKNRTLLWGGGYSYGVALSPDKTKIAYHLTCIANEFCPSGCHYAMNCYDLKTGERHLVHCQPGHLMFGSSWMPDGKYIVFQDCYADKDPAHYFSDICIATPDGKKVRYLTEGQRAYFGTAFGSENARFGGSNYPVPISDTELLYSLCSPGAHPDCTYRPELGNHRENAYAPECAKGGASIFLHDLTTKTVTPVTKYEEGKWDFRPYLTPDRKHIIYTTVRNGETSALHICALDGSGDRFITKGFQGGNADHVRYHKEING